MPLASEEIDNALVNQKDELLALVAKSSDPESLERVLATLQFLAPLWRALDYGYKVREVASRIAQRATQRIAEEETDLTQYRRGTRLHTFTCREIEKLLVVVTEPKHSNLKGTSPVTQYHIDVTNSPHDGGFYAELWRMLDGKTVHTTGIYRTEGLARQAAEDWLERMDPSDSGLVNLANPPA